MERLAKSRGGGHGPQKAARCRQLVVAVLALLLWQAAWFMPYMPDDAFIVARYAVHIAAGQGYTFDGAGPRSTPTSACSRPGAATPRR